MSQSSIDKKVAELLRRKPELKKQAYKSKSFLIKLEDEVEKLKECMLKYTNSETVQKSIITEKENDGTLTITFNKNLATKPSFFTKWGYDYPADAYMPILKNEGYQVKHPRWKIFFGKGSHGVEERFIELGIMDYKKTYGDNLKINVRKIFNQRYSAYNEIIDTDFYY